MEMETDSINYLLAFNLKRLRKERDWNQADLAAKTDLSVAMIAHLESGHKWASDSTIKLLAHVFMVPPSELFRNPNAIIKPTLNGALTVLTEATELLKRLCASYPMDLLELLIEKGKPENVQMIRSFLEEDLDKSSAKTKAKQLAPKESLPKTEEDRRNYIIKRLPVTFSDLLKLSMWLEAYLHRGPVPSVGPIRTNSVKSLDELQTVVLEMLNTCDLNQLAWTAKFLEAEHAVETMAPAHHGLKRKSRYA